MTTSERPSRPQTRGGSQSKDPQPIRKKQRGVEDYDDEYLQQPLDEKQRSEWKGWCEIESEPAFFNTIVKEWGVRGIRVKEVLDMDQWEDIPKPIYGFILLFQYRADSPDKMEKCPADVWFAQQVAQNSCASIALLNIIMNIPDIDVGDSIADLKRRTSGEMTPRKRGQLIKTCEFIRWVHNSFASKRDYHFTVVKDLKQPKTPQKNVKKKTSKKIGKSVVRKSIAGHKRKANDEEDEEIEENAYHFIAFVPINGKLWKLDGMDAQPMNLGPSRDDWTDLAREDISERMAAAEAENGAISFSLQALCCSPLKTIPMLLAQNIARLICLDSILRGRDAGWAAYLDPESSIASTIDLVGPDGKACVTPELLANAKSKLEADERAHPHITSRENSTTVLADMRERLMAEQKRLHSEYMEEVCAVEEEEELMRKLRQQVPKEDSMIKVQSRATRIKSSSGTSQNSSVDAHPDTEMQDVFTDPQTGGLDTAFESNLKFDKMEHEPTLKPESAVEHESAMADKLAMEHDRAMRKYPC